MIMNRSIKILLLFFIWLGTGFGQPGSISLESKVDRAKITIGDRIIYTILITRDEQVTVELPEFGANLGAFEILDYNDPEPQKLNGNIVQTRQYTVSTFDIGEYEIPPVTIRYSTTGDTTWKELSTEKIKIEVESLKPSEAGDIRDIKPPLELKRDYKNLIRMAIVIVCLLLIALLIYYFIKRRRAGKSLLPLRTKPPRPAHEVALEELDKLVQSDLLKKGKVKQFYIIISEIIRRYIEGRYKLIAIEMTTTQLIQNMQVENIEPSIIDIVAEFLHRCDFVKFAKYIPRDEENEDNIQQAYEIVHRTKIVFETIVPEEKAPESVSQENALEKADRPNSNVTLAEKEVE